MVTAIDRIRRRAVDGLRFIRDVTDAGVHLVVLSQREFDTTTPTGQLLLHLTLAIAQWEWSNIRDRSIQGQQRARAEGKRIGRPPVLTPEARQEVEKKLLEGHRSPASPRCTGSTSPAMVLRGFHHTTFLPGRKVLAGFFGPYAR